jgi:DNA-directed RNA polymerase specialized sigma24 family protein
MLMTEKKQKPKKIHYVDNQKFLEEMIVYKGKCKDAKNKGEPAPQISEYVGECFMKIANRLSFRPNFINYAFREDMISDGIENCVQYIRNFDPEKSKNPFAYFTQIIYFAFIRRIQKEKKQLYIKYKTMDTFGALGDNVEVSDHDKGHYDYNTLSTDQKANMYDFIKNFEEAKKAKSVTKKPTKTKTTNLEYFFVTS